MSLLSSPLPHGATTSSTADMILNNIDETPPKAYNTSRQVRHCEHLAQKLYTRSRDSVTLYKTLTGSLRSLRNVLEEVHEALHSSPSCAFDEVKLVCQLDQCKCTLERLDIGLVSYKCTNKTDVTSEDILDIKASVEDVARDLAKTHETMTNTEEKPMPACTTASSRRESQSSLHSSSWSVVNRDGVSDASGSASPVMLDIPKLSEEKELFCPRSAQLQSSPSNPASSTASWRSPFARPDPLSVSLAHASRLILSGEEDIITQAADQQDVENPKECVMKIVQPDNTEHEHMENSPRQDSVILGTAGLEEKRGEVSRIGNFELPLITLLPAISLRPASDSPADESRDGLKHRSSTSERVTTAIATGKDGIQPRNSATRGEAVTPPPRPAPPPPRRSTRSSLPVITYIHKDIRTARPPSPSGSDASEDLYSLTPPRQKTPICADRSLIPPPLTVSKTTIQRLPVGTGPVAESASQSERNLSPESRREHLSEFHTGQVEMGELLGVVRTSARLKSNSCSDLVQPTLLVPTEDRTSQEQPSKSRLWPSRYLKARQRRSSAAPELIRDWKGHQRRSASTSGLEVYSEKTPAARHLSLSPWISRIGVDEMLRKLSTSSKTTAVQLPPNLPPRGVDGESRSLDHSEALDSWKGPDFVGFRTWFDRDAEGTPTSLLDRERIQIITHFWNKCLWDQAEKYLIGHLDSLVARSEDQSAVRRVQHLLAIICSLRGEWREATSRFLKVLRLPIQDVADLDDGDCAAAYWLGDLYALCNRRTDALLAYAIAQRSSMFHDPSLKAQQGYCAEKRAVQLGVSKADFRERVPLLPGDDDDDDDNDDEDEDEDHVVRIASVVDAKIAKTLLETEPRRVYYDSDRPNITTPDQKLSRTSYLGSGQVCLDQRYFLKISPAVFEPSSPWPHKYDPLFCMPNVQRGRLLAFECDMLAVFQTNPDAKIPRPLSLSKIDCFTCTDLVWLIRTIRACLQTFEMNHSEVVNVQGTWFCCRYSFMQACVATTHYFSIALFRHPFRAGYGVEICSEEGMCSARLVMRSVDYDRGVPVGEPKRLKKLIREYLDSALRNRANNSDAYEPPPPPLPPKPTSSDRQ